MDPAETTIEQAAPAGVAVLRLCQSADSLDDALAALARAEADEARRDEVRALLTAETFALIKRVLGRAAHGSGATPQAWAEVFDALAAEPAEAGSALYALGDPGRLEAATAEVIAWLESAGCLDREAAVLEIGCGSGRFQRALRGRTRAVFGLDVAEAMARQAARGGAAVVRGSGRDLAPVRDESLDLVLAVDSWPYLVDAGVERTHLTEARRVLRPGGRLVVLNWSYGDESGAAQAAALAGFSVERAGERPFRLWDGRAFLFRRT